MYACPDCFTTTQDIRDGWITCENCNNSFTLDEVLHPQLSPTQELIHAVETLLFEIDTYGTTEFSVGNLRQALKKTIK